MIDHEAIKRRAEELSAYGNCAKAETMRQAGPDITALLSEVERHRGGVEFICAACGTICQTLNPSISLDSGTVLKCECDGKTIVRLETPEEYGVNTNLRAEVERLNGSLLLCQRRLTTCKELMGLPT